MTTKIVKKKKSAREKRVLISAFIVAAVMIGGSTFAWFTSTDEVTNRLSAKADYNVSIVESFEPPANWIPGQDINKDVYAVNTGNIPAFVKETISGVLTIKHENAVKEADFNPNCVQLTRAERYVVEAGAYLAWKPEKSAKQIGREVINMIPDSANLDAYTVNTETGLTDFEPDVEGLYVFRRAITVDSSTKETFTYDGYYFKEGKFYKITNLESTPDIHDDLANDGDDKDGQLSMASADYVKEVSESVTPTLTYDATANELLATYDTGVTPNNSLEAIAKAYDAALAEFERASEALNRAKADSGVEGGGGTAEELVAKKDELDTAYFALQTAYTAQRAAQTAYNTALTNKTNAQNAYDAAKKAVEDSKTKLYGSATGTEESAMSGSLYKTYKEAIATKDNATENSRTQFNTDFATWASTNQNNKGTSDLADYTYNEFIQFPASDINYTYYQAVAAEKLAKEAYEAELTKLYGVGGSDTDVKAPSYQNTLDTTTTTLGDTSSGAIAAFNTAEETKNEKDAALTTAQNNYKTALQNYNKVLADNNVDNAEYNEALAAFQNAENKMNAAKNAYNEAYGNGTGTASSNLTIHIKLSDKVVPAADGSADKWQLLPSILTDNKKAEFCYTGILEPGETSSKLIESVELDKMTTKEMYKSFDFDLNVLLNSVQITYADDNETIKADQTQTELGWSADLADAKSLNTAVAWESYIAPALTPEPQTEPQTTETETNPGS